MLSKFNKPLTRPEPYEWLDQSEQLGNTGISLRFKEHFQKMIENCLCGVPPEIHGTSCGMAHASVVILPSGESKYELPPDVRIQDGQLIWSVPLPQKEISLLLEPDSEILFSRPNYGNLSVCINSNVSIQSTYQKTKLKQMKKLILSIGMVLAMTMGVKAQQTQQAQPDQQKRYNITMSIPEAQDIIFILDKSHEDHSIVAQLMKTLTAQLNAALTKEKADKESGDVTNNGDRGGIIPQVKPAKKKGEKK